MKFIGSIILAAAVNAQYPASLLGDVALTSVAGVEFDGDFGQQDLPVGTHIYGPFEAGFTATQDFILAKLGCATGKGYVEGGIDTYTAEQMVAQDCGVTLPRWENTTTEQNYVSLVGTCGGHTGDYHFHERLNCLYTQEGGHSTQVGNVLDGKALYGKWENTETKQLPQVDACNGHWGPTPDSNGEDVYHYHVTDRPPFTVGCFGPNPDNTPVSVLQCRALYSTCGDGETTLSTTFGDVKYDTWCPCYDATGSNVGTEPYAWENDSIIAAGPGGESVLQAPDSSTSINSKTGGMKKGMKKGMTDKKSGFRIEGEGEQNCPDALFMIQSAKRNNMCVDATNKRLGLKKCNDETAGQLFSMNQIGAMMHVAGHDGQCISSGSLTSGPCDAGISVSRTGAKFQFKLGARCMNAQPKRLNLVKCNKKMQTQAWYVVPTFKTTAPASTFRHSTAKTEGSAGFRVNQGKGKGKGKNKGSGFRLGGGKKGKKGDDELDE